MSDTAMVPHGWEGYQDGAAAVGEGLSEATNVSFYYDGELRRRPGLGSQYNFTVTLLGAIEHPTQGSFLLGMTSTGTLKSYGADNVTSGANLASGLSTANRGQFAYNNGAVYFTNDLNLVQVIRNPVTSAVSAGMVGPASAPGLVAQNPGSVDAGSHLVRYRYKNSQTGYVSNASPAVTTVALGGTDLEYVVVIPADSKVDQLVMEATTVNGSTFYVCSTVAMTSPGVFNMSDAILAQQVGASATDGDQLGSGHEPPPISQMLIEHRARLFAWGSTSVSLTCTVTGGSTTVTSATNGFSASWVGRQFQVGTQTAIYTITTANISAITLMTAYVAGATGSVTATIFAAIPDLLYWSRAGYPESWKPLSWARRVFQGASDVPTAIASLYGDLYLIGRRGMRRLVYTDDPATGMLVTIPTTLGAWNYRCTVNANGQLFGWGREGAWTISGLQPKHISRDIDDTVNALLDITKLETFFGFYDPREKVVWWMYTKTGDIAPRDALCYDVIRQQWSRRKFRNSLVDGLTMGDSARTTKVYLADNVAFTWTLDPGRLFDCIPTTLTTGAITVDVGSTTSTINVVEAMPTGSATVNGSFMSNFTTGEDVRVTGTTSAHALTVSPAFATAPVAGTTLYLGSIFCRLISNWWPGTTDLSYRDRPAYLVVEQANAEVVTVSVRLFRDFSATPVTFTTFGSTYDPPTNGVTITNNATTITGDLSTIGTYFPMPSDWSKALRFEITQHIPFGTLQILDARFEYKDQAAENPKANVP